MEEKPSLAQRKRLVELEYLVEETMASPEEFKEYATLRGGRAVAEPSRGAPDAWAYDCALVIVNGAYSLHGRPIIGNSNEVEAKQLADMILRFHQSCETGHVVLLEALRRVQQYLCGHKGDDGKPCFLRECEKHNFTIGKILREIEAAIKQAERP